jgi:predicted MFS family arabinose efflux permease
MAIRAQRQPVAFEAPRDQLNLSVVASTPLRERLWNLLPITLSLFIASSLFWGPYYAPNVLAVGIVAFFAYSTMFAFNMATPSYLHKIARPGELSPSLAMGVTFEHLAGVAIPIAGGMLWVTYGYTYAFLVGAVIASICFLTVTRLPKGRLIKLAGEAG